MFEWPGASRQSGEYAGESGDSLIADEHLNHSFSSFLDFIYFSFWQFSI